MDTPGQIEAFTWSASGTVITDSLASTFPTVLVYVIDTPRSVSPTTFMSNMLYACSILFKTKLPFVVVFNKTDVISHEFIQEWMEDFESFQVRVVCSYACVAVVSVPVAHRIARAGSVGCRQVRWLHQRAHTLHVYGVGRILQWLTQCRRVCHHRSGHG